METQNSIGHKLVCTLIAALLSFSLALSPFQAERAHAVVPVVVGGVAALAAELGVSEAALMAAIAAGAAAVTGLGVAISKNDIAAGNFPSDIALPGFKPWDDLDAQEKDAWGDLNGGTIGEDAGNAHYWERQFDWYGLAFGWTQPDGNGGSEPTPEPDKNTDPDGHKKWQKGRNVLALLATGGVVGIADVVGTVGENFVNSLFKPSTDDIATSGLGLTFTYNGSLDGIDINMAYHSGCTYTYQGQQYVIGPSDWGVFNLGYGSYNNKNSVVWTYYLFNDGDVVVIESSNHDKYQVNDTYNRRVYNYIDANSGWLCVNSNANLSNRSVTGRQDTNNYYWLNPYYSGTYKINGTEYSGDEILDLCDPDYGQIADTPDYIVNNINDYGDLVNNINYNQTQPDDKKLGVQIPDGFTGPGGTPSWNDYVKIVPDTEIDTPSDEEPYDPTQPDNPTDPDNPTNPDLPDFDFDSSVSDALGGLANSFTGMLFPFCLINDIKSFTDKVSESMGFSNRRGVVMSDAVGSDVKAAQQYVKIDVPLDEFNVDGMDNFELDLTDLLHLGNLARPWWTVLCAISLISESIRYFLK